MDLVGLAQCYIRTGSCLVRDPYRSHATNRANGRISAKNNSIAFQLGDLSPFIQINEKCCKLIGKKMRLFLFFDAANGWSTKCIFPEAVVRELREFGMP